MEPAKAPRSTSPNSPKEAPKKKPAQAPRSKKTAAEKAAERKAERKRRAEEAAAAEEAAEKAREEAAAKEQAEKEEKAATKLQCLARCRMARKKMAEARMLREQREKEAEEERKRAKEREFPQIIWVDIETAENTDCEKGLLEIEAATDGLYHRTEERGPDGMPVWKKEDGHTWFFSGTYGTHEGFWCVGDDDFKDAQFGRLREGSAYISSFKPHDERPPHKLSQWYSCGMYCSVIVSEVGNEAFAPGNLVKVIDEGFDGSVGGFERKRSLGKVGEVVEVFKDARPYKVKLVGDASKAYYARYEAVWLQKVNNVYDIYGTLRWDEHHVICWDTDEECMKWWDDERQRWGDLDDSTKDVFDTFDSATREQILSKTGSPGLLESTVTCLPDRSASKLR